MGYFEKHVFVCTNQRAAGEACCQGLRALEMQAYAKQRLQSLGLSGTRRIRINKSGCLDRCELGPVLVVYPDGVWYTFVDETDIDEIIDRHLLQGQIVERLRLPDAQPNAGPV
ncbi:MAG: (2Fe-2S) ferredoxin domain-containing protein [Burkholderiaceae bacterium]|jgi:(2Fe-2S) ferredoxin